MIDLLLLSVGEFFHVFSYELITTTPKRVWRPKTAWSFQKNWLISILDQLKLLERLLTWYIHMKRIDGGNAYLQKTVGNSQLKFDMIRLIPGDHYVSACFVKLKQHADAQKFEEILLANKNKMPRIFQE